LPKRLFAGNRNNQRKGFDTNTDFQDICPFQSGIRFSPLKGPRYFLQPPMQEKSIVNSNNRHYHRGVTVMEVLIGLAFLLILVAFVAPNLQRESGRNEMSRTLSDFNQHLEMARFAARRLESEITVDINKDLRAKNHSISFVLPGEPKLDPVLKEYVLPENIRIHSEQSNIRIDSTGAVATPAQIELTSERSRFFSERLLVE